MFFLKFKREYIYRAQKKYCVKIFANCWKFLQKITKETKKKYVDID